MGDSSDGFLCRSLVKSLVALPIGMADGRVYAWMKCLDVEISVGRELTGWEGSMYEQYARRSV